MVDTLCTAGEHLRWLTLRNEAHQIEKVAAFLYKSSARVSIEAIPIINLP